ncbi:MAG: peptidoglycan DD-metalloendopeptidase family protein [Oscillospiraceae bacterium]
MKKPWTEHIGDFIAGKGFYIVLFLCVAAIGISGYYLFSTLGPGGEDTAVSKPTQVVVTPSPAPSASAPPVKVTPTPTPKPSATPTPTPAPSPSASAASVFTWPVKGEVIHDFSLEVLAYDETMGDWRTHCGIDIAADVGTQVCAVSGGTVEQVYQDDLMGTTVVINHGKGLYSTYSNLASVPTVEAGDTVSTGSVIGSVGRTALAEGDQEAHLHLEMSMDGLDVDPMQYLPG